MTVPRQVEQLLRELAPRVLGVLVRRTGDFETCEDAVQEALLAAATQWPAEGVPANPTGWLVTVASRRWTEAWRSETDRLPPEPVPTRSSTTQGVVAVLPLGLFVAAVVLGSVALTLSARPLLAAAFVCLAASALLFFLVPLREMLRHRTHD